ncbi:MAG: DUF333 domain-containing protein [Anaerolineae bacterium]|nr:DUF333 domain-containing protein [Anaerolineae bacterium]
MCIFPDGSECDEWEYARGECKPASEDEEIGIANPASVFCEEQGGTLEIRDTEEGQLGYCLFDDGSECEEWAFFRGECAPGGAKFLPPTTASKDAQLGGLAIAETEVLIAESFPVQVTLHVSGDMPTPCHQLAVEIRPPDDDNVIMVVLSSWQEDNGLACAQVMTPFFSNITIPIDELAEGAYTVWVNGYEVGEFNLP